MTALRNLMSGLAATAGSAALAFAGAALAQEQFPDAFDETAAHEPRWIHEDIDKGYAEAETSGKPLLVVFRCVP